MKNILIKQKEVSKVRGVITLRAYKAGTDILLKEIITENLVMQGSATGLNQFIKRLIGDTTYTCAINYVAIGTSNTAPAITDTQLGTETVRVAISTADEITVGQARIKCFFCR